jgi:hypothetical protein
MPKNTLVSVNSIISKFTEILSFNSTGAKNIVAANAVISTTIYNQNDISYTAALLNFFMGRAGLQDAVRIETQANKNSGMIQLRTFEQHADGLQSIIKTQHQEFADALTNGRPYPDSHFAYMFPQIVEPQHEINGLAHAMSALYQAGLGFDVTFSFRPMAHIENKNRTPGLLAVHRNQLLLFQPDYAFHPDYENDKNGISTHSTVTRSSLIKYPAVIEKPASALANPEFDNKFKI